LKSKNIKSEEENEEEQHIDPKDLIMINDPKKWEQTQKQILNYSKQLGYIDSDPKGLLQISEKT
jgi:hypothetical protein